MQLTMRYVEETAEGGEEQDALEAGLLQDVDELLEDDDDGATPGGDGDDDGTSQHAAAAAGRSLASAYDVSPRVPEGALLDVAVDDDDLRPPPPPPSTSRPNQVLPPPEEEEEEGDNGGWGDAFSDYSAPRGEEEARASIPVELEDVDSGKRGPGHSRGDSAAWGLEDEDEAALLDDVQASPPPPVVVDLGRDKKERID